MPVSVAVSDQGCRAQMEDAHFLDGAFGESGSVFGGVYDGHCGSLAARHAADRLHMYFLGCLRAGMTPSRAFPVAYHKVSDDLRDQVSGTTAATFLLEDNLIHTANAGDSRIILIGAGGATQLTVDHRLDDPDELKRVMLCGGKIRYPYVMKGSEGVMATRALGDEYFRDAGVIPTPFVKVHSIREQDAWLVAATDGLFDVIDNRETAKICEKHADPIWAAEDLVLEATRRCRVTDNISIIVVRLR